MARGRDPCGSSAKSLLLGPLSGCTDYCLPGNISQHLMSTTNSMGDPSNLGPRNIHVQQTPCLWNFLDMTSISGHSVNICLKQIYYQGVFFSSFLWIRCMVATWLAPFTCMVLFKAIASVGVMQIHAIVLHAALSSLTLVHSRKPGIVECHINRQSPNFKRE